MGKSPSGLSCIHLFHDSAALVPPLPPDGLSRHARAVRLQISLLLLHQLRFDSAFAFLVMVGAVAIPGILYSTVTLRIALPGLPYLHSLAFSSVLACRSLTVC
ncbi:hypothetical protein LX36DRAFT_178384 [Colletotrichum falcatum]|nr:hypothetical protein LX36DRAFT_178384 [Colletotrichum falcatum]